MHRLVRSSLVLVAVACSGSAIAAAATGATTQIVQQRSSDGRIVLTDHPSADAVTERTWRMPAEDPVAARQRASEVRAEAARVSERIERLLEQQRRVALENERLRLATAERERQREQDRGVFSDEGVWADGVVLFAPARRALLRDGQPRFDDRSRVDDRPRRGDHAPGMRPPHRSGGPAPTEPR